MLNVASNKITKGEQSSKTRWKSRIRDETLIIGAGPGMGAGEQRNTEAPCLGEPREHLGIVYKNKQ